MASFHTKIKNRKNKKNLMDNRFFVFELLDSTPHSSEYVVRLSYQSVFDTLDILKDYYRGGGLFKQFNELLEHVAVSPQNILLRNNEDISELYFMTIEFIDSLCGVFFNSKSDMLDIRVDPDKFEQHQEVVNDFKDIAHVLSEWVSIFKKIKYEQKTVLIYADFMIDVFLLDE